MHTDVIDSAPKVLGNLFQLQALPPKPSKFSAFDWLRCLFAARFFRIATP
jgi:hypothetical protein